MSFLKSLFTKSSDSAAAAVQEPAALDPSYLLNAPEIVGWLSTEEQHLLFDAMLLFYQDTDSVLDVGCGRADLYGFLQSKSDIVNYKGIDLNSNLISLANVKYPTAAVESVDILSYNPDYTFDWVMGSGLFNLNDHPNMVEYAKECIDKMYRLSSKGVVFNLLTGIPADLPESDANQLVVHNAGEWLNYLVEKYTKVYARADYMSGDITFFIFNF